MEGEAGPKAEMMIANGPPCLLADVDVERFETHGMHRSAARCIRVLAWHFRQL